LQDKNNISESIYESEFSPFPAGFLNKDICCPQPWSSSQIEFSLKKQQAVFFTLDMGREILAAPELSLEGKSGTIVDIAYSESLDNNRVAVLQSKLKQPERIILGQRPLVHRINQPRGFRYIIIRFYNPGNRACQLKFKDLCAFETIYPAQMQGAFNCSNSLLDEIYHLSARTVNLCMEDVFTDCPWRERAAWVGDAQPEALFSYYCFGDYKLARKAVIEFSSGNTEEGWIPGVFPTGQPLNLPTWGMRVPVIAWEYYFYSGDDSILPLVMPGINKLMNWFEKHEDKDGIFADNSNWNFVDWTKLDARNNDGAVQGWYVEALEYAAKLASAVKEKSLAAKYSSKAAGLRKKLPDL